MTDPRMDAWSRALVDGSFEEARSALEEVVAHLEAGHLALAESLDAYELGMRLADRCDRMLADADLRIAEVDATAYGAAAEPPDASGPGREPLEMFSLDDVPF